MGTRTRRVLYAGAGCLAALVVFNVAVELAAVPSAIHATTLPGAEPRVLGPEDATAAAVFVHGFVGAGNNFNDLPDRLAEAGWRVYVLQLPGHGTNPKHLRDIAVGDLTDAVRVAVNEAGETADFVALVGHSMGGALSAITAAEGGVDALVLGAPFFGVTHRWYYGFHPDTWMRLTSPVVRWTYKGKLFLQVNRREAKQHIVSYTWIPAEGFNLLGEIRGRVNAPELLAQIQCPVLWMHSPNDVAASYTEAQRAVEAMVSPRKEQLRLDAANHHIFWDYGHEEVVNTTVTFLESCREGHQR